MARALGRDFWTFRAGQLVSLLGDGCSTIALSWWILDKTGSAAEMSAVLAPAMAARVVLLPVMGSVADRFPRKRLILLADAWRFACSAALAALVRADWYSRPALIALYMASGAGSALFAAAAGAIVPQLVDREDLGTALQQTQAADSFGRVAGGVVGGLVVTALGVFGAFAVDAASYLFSAGSCLLIRAATAPERAAATARWRSELSGGFRAVLRIPVLFWLCAVAMFMNLALAPTAVLLPMLAKEARGMPAWFLGGLESSVSLGAIVGALSVGRALRVLSAERLMIAGVAMMGAGVALLPWTPNALLPLSVLFWIGVGVTWANIPLATQIALAVPDSHRARVGAMMNFLCTGIAPIGVAAAGVLTARFGLTPTLVGLGLSVAAMTPILLLIPDFRPFLTAPPDEAAGFFSRRWPGAFAD